MASDTLHALLNGRTYLTGRWIKGRFEDSRTGRVCAVGALHKGNGYEAGSMTASADPAVREAQRLLDSAVPVVEEDIIGFNDNFAQSETDVAKVYDTAIRSAPGVI